MFTSSSPDLGDETCNRYCFEEVPISNILELHYSLERKKHSLRHLQRLSGRQASPLSGCTCSLLLIPMSTNVSVPHLSKISISGVFMGFKPTKTLFNVFLALQTLRAPTIVSIQQTKLTFWIQDIDAFGSMLVAYICDHPTCSQWPCPVMNVVFLFFTHGTTCQSPTWPSRLLSIPVWMVSKRFFFKMNHW